MAAKKSSGKKTSAKRASKKRSSRGRRSAEYGGEFPVGQGIGTALIHDGSGEIRTVQYVEIDGMAMFEGDICLGTVEQVERDSQIVRQEMRGELARGVVLTGANRRWTNCQVPFVIDPDLPDQERVTDAIAHWEANTNYRFIERTAENAAQFPDFVKFRPASNCSSSVGRRGGQQFINLGSGCTTGNTIHEIGHTIGLWHEQSRSDRDAFVTINFANIAPAAVNNFDQHITDGDDVGPYDYGSIMHYPRTAFSINGEETITPTDPSAEIGQRVALSPGDIAAANSLCTPLPGGTANKLVDDAATINKFVDDPRTANKFFDDPRTANKFFDDPRTANKFFDDPRTANKFFDDPRTANKFFDDPRTANKFFDDPRTANKFFDDPGTANKFQDDPGTHKQTDDVKSPARDKGPQDVGPRVPGTVRPLGGERLPFALATPHHAPPAMVAAAGGIGGMDAGQLAASIDQLRQYVEELAWRLSDGADEQHDPYGQNPADELMAEYERAVGELQQSLDLYHQLTGQLQ